MNTPHLHNWNLNPEQARQVQERLRSQIIPEDRISLETLHWVAGVDNGYVRGEEETIAYACAVVLDYPSLQIVETQYASQPVTFPYIPGLLSFRESPVMLAALQKLENIPDVILVDAHGLAHPRRLGAASHLGLLLDRPTIGCAKSRLTGSYTEPGNQFGAWQPLIDRKNDEVIGAVVRTKPGHTPLFVSIGNQISLDTALTVTLACCREDNFLPEPSRLAHQLVTAYTAPFRKR